MSGAADQRGQVADLVVERLAEWGVRRIYGYAGDGNNPLLGALRRGAEAPEFIRAKHEEGAAFMAVGEAKYTGGVGVVTSTQGPGAVHLLCGLYDAKLDSAPVVALVGQQHTSVLGSDYQQEIDLQHLFHDVASPFVQMVSSPEQLPMVLDRAFRSALTRAQPAVVILPHDVQQAPTPELGQSHGVVVTAPRWTTGRLLPRDEDLDAAVSVIEAGERIAILAGRGIAHAQEEVVRLAERLGAGIATSLLGKPYVDESHPLSVGTMGHLGTTASARLLQECDTLLILGSNDPWTEFYPPPGQARAVQVDVDPAVIAGRYPVEVGLVGDSAATVEALLERVEPRGETAWRSEVERQVRNWHEISRLRSEVPADPLNPELVVRRFGEQLSGDWQLAIDVGSAVYHYVRQMRLPTSVPAHLSSTLASMGCGIPFGIAAKENAPDRPVAVLAGDGAMQMLGNTELLTLAERWRRWRDPRFVVLVLHNRDLAEVSWEQREMEAQPRFEDSQEVPRFDFAGYAELLGFRGIRISRSEDVPAALEEAFATDRPVIVEALTDPDVPLLPPFPHGREQLDSMRVGLRAEGAAGARGLGLLDAYVRIEEAHG
ncbi:thiamine pyrophosphate-requiring protein [Leucobacter sp. CSA1]|uniref:Thiamine pyrophosphate-requiring protein n=1 Tax=Leucobacter chromiisoli TaxID=2796471 RepID=A0A934Q9I2_9MICO|nr:thiamine pyrophosphate-requiring protein [Leucobacter chromiisoli]MBK0419032.1 thiamine pyrophosphate-requiring protein [Leucobacter chromiisoli]